MRDDEYEGLSPEEIEAIKGGGGDEDENDGAAGVSDDKSEGGSAEVDGDGENAVDDKTGDEGEKEPVIDDADKGKKDEDAKGEAGDAAAGDGEKTAADKEQRPFVPQFAGEEQEKIDKLKTELEDAKKKFDEGEIDYAAFSASKDQYNEAKWKSDFSKEMNSNMQDERWTWEQERFLDDNRPFRDNSLLNSAFVSSVNKIIASDEGVNLSDREVLLQAKNEVDAAIRDLTGGTKAPVDKQAADKTKAITDAKKTQSDRGKIPADIADLPAAQENSEKKEFEGMKKLSGQAYQDALERMTPEQQAKYEDSNE